MPTKEPSKLVQQKLPPLRQTSIRFDNHLNVSQQVNRHTKRFTRQKMIEERIFFSAESEEEARRWVYLLRWLINS